MKSAILEKDCQVCGHCNHSVRAVVPCLLDDQLLPASQQRYHERAAPVLPDQRDAEELLSDFYPRVLSAVFQNSFIVSFGTIAIVLLVAVPASYALSRYNFFGRRVILSSVSSVQMFPVVVILTTLYGFYNSWHMLDTYRGLILADTTFALPLAITLMKSFFDTLSKSLDEAARIDGASRMRVLLHILLPLVVPGLVAVGIYTFLNAWDDYLMALTIMKSNEMRTLPVGIAQSFLGEYSNDYGGLMAFAVAGSLPIVLLFIFFQKYLVSGMTAGAVKG